MPFVALSARPSPSTSRRSRAAVLVGLLVAVTAALATVATAAPTNAAAATVPLTVTNAGGPGPLHLYVLGTDLATGRQGYVTSAGRFTPWSLPTADGVTGAPDVSIDGPASGAQLPISLPRNVSGRLYFSYGAPLWLGLTRGGLVQPAPWNAGDPNALTLLDWSEFTYDAGGLWLNSSQVDQFAIPHEVSVTGTDGSTRRTGGLSSSRYAAAVAEILAAPGFGRTAMYAGNGSLLRVLSPGKATATGRMDPAYLNPAIEAAWSGSAGVIRINPFAGDPARTYVGRGVGSQMTFTDSTGRPVAAFSKPTSLDVWECAGALTAPNDAVVGPIARTLCAALHRGTLGSGVVEPVTDPATFYRAAVSDHYAGAIHAAMSDHLAYGFAFDDVANQESLVHDPNPVSAGIVLQPGTGAGGAVSPTPTPTTSPAPTPTPTATPTPTPTAPPTTTSSTTRTVTVTFPDHAPGWATLALGPGTAAGLLTIAVQGGSTSTVSVDGPATVRADLSGPAGPHLVTVRSTGALGPVSITLP